MKTFLRYLVLGVLLVILVGIIVVVFWTQNPGTLYRKASDLEGKSEYTGAVSLYKKAKKGFLKRGDKENADACRIRMFQIEKVRLEYPYTMEEAEKMLEEEFPGISAKVRSSWLQEGKVQSVNFDGTQYFYGDLVKNLKHRNKKLIDEKFRSRPRKFFNSYRSIIFRDPNAGYPVKSSEPYIKPMTFLGNQTLRLSKEILPDTGTLQIWFPLPIQTNAQSCVKVVSISPGKYIKYPPSIYGDIGVAYMSIPLERVADDLEFDLQFLFTHYEQRFIVDPNTVGRYDKSSDLYKRYTASKGNIAVTPEIRKKAGEIVGVQKNPYRAAKMIYYYVVNNISYSYIPHASLSVFNIPESVYVHEKGYGDCGSQSMYFSALCRAMGIPARTAGGYQLSPAGQSTHFWAEIYLPNYGWIPVDTSVGQIADYLPGVSKQQKDKYKAYFFGNQDPYRWTIQNDVDIPLIPPASEPVLLPTVIQFPAVVCKTSEKNIGIEVIDNWKVKCTPVDR